MEYTVLDNPHYPEDFFFQWVHPNGKELQLQQEISNLKQELERVRSLAKERLDRFNKTEENHYNELTRLYAAIKKANDTILDLRIQNRQLISNDK